MPSYSGIWTLQAQMQAVAAGTWPGLSKLYAFGRNNNGQLGLGDTAGRSSPVQVGSLGDWKVVSGGNNWSVAVKTNGTLWAWGYGSTGSLGSKSDCVRKFVT